MGIWVNLEGLEREVQCRCVNCDNEHVYSEKEELYSSNTTHNLGAMASEVGIYKAIWRPEEIGILKAHQLIQILKDGITRLRDEREHCEQFNASNGWGTYKQFVPWVQDYLNACIEYPDADVRVSR